MSNPSKQLQALYCEESASVPSAKCLKIGTQDTCVSVLSVE